MKKIGVILLVLMFFLVGCKEEPKATGLEAELTGQWLLTERHMVIEFDTEENNYVEFKDTFDLPTQVQARYIRYDANEEYELDFEHMNATSFYTQTFDATSCAVENYVKTEVSHYVIEYGEDQIFYKLDEEKSNKEYVDVYETNGFYNKVSFEDGNLILTLVLTAEDFEGDANYEEVKRIESTMILTPYEEEQQ